MALDMDLRKQVMNAVCNLSDEQLKNLKYGNIDFVVQNGNISRLDIRISVKPNYKINMSQAN